MSQQIPREVVEMFIPRGAKRMEVDLGEGYEVYITRDWYNPLVKRREIDALIIHIGKPTPSRMKLRMQFAKALNVDVKRLYIRSVKSEYGVGASRIEIHIYDSAERALQFEPSYIIERNKLPEEMEE